MDRPLRSRDDRAMLVRPPQNQLIALSHVMNPTWRGAYDWLEGGLFPSITDQAGAPPVKATEAPSPSASPELATIGTVVAVDSKDYVIERLAPEACTYDGSAGDHLKLRARTDPVAHPLTDVVIDSTGRFCAMTFSLGSPSAMSFRGTFRLNFAPVGSYWMIVGGRGEFGVRIFGISTSRSDIDLAYDTFQFPSALPDAEFDPGAAR